MRMFFYTLLLVGSNVLNIQAAPPDILAGSKATAGFIKNNGQYLDENHQRRDDILYVYRNDGFSLILKSSGFSYQLQTVVPINKGDYESGTPTWEADEDDESGTPAEQIFSSRVDVDFVNSKQNITVTGTNPVPYYLNYYTQSDPITRVPVFKEVRYSEVYEGIDLVFYFAKNNEGRYTLKYDWVIRENGDAGDIALSYSGTKEMKIKPDGSLYLGQGIGFVSEGQPILSNQNAGLPTPVYHLDGTTLTLGNVKGLKGKNVIVDPVLQWGFYFGGGRKELPDDISVDESENIYVAGRSLSATLYFQSIPAASSTMVASNENDAFLVKFDADMNLLWCTYFGGLKEEKPFTIAIDPKTQEVFMAGKTDSEEGVAFNCNHDPTDYKMDCIYGNNFDGFIAKFTTSGDVIRSSYVGSGDQEYILGVTSYEDDSGNVVVYATGTAEGDGGIVRPSHPDVEQFVYSGGDKDHGDMFVLKFNSDLSERIWGTYYGTLGGQERGHEITVDSAGNIYIVGTMGFNFDGMAKGDQIYQSVRGGLGDAHLSRWTPDGKCTWLTYYGGPDYDRGRDVKTDRDGNIYIGGKTVAALSFPNAIVSTSDMAKATTTSVGDNDGYIAKFNPNGGLIWGSFFGGTGYDDVRGVYVDPLGSPIYVCGYTNSQDLPVTSDAYSPIKSSGDYYFAKLNFNGTRINYCTYYGGTGFEGEIPASFPDWYNGIMDVGYPSKNIYICSGTTSTCGIEPSCKCADSCNTGGYGDWDAFVAKFTDPCGGNDPLEPNDLVTASINKLPIIPFPNVSPVTWDASLSPDAGDSVDYFPFNLPADAYPVKITLFQPDGADYKIALLDQNGTLIASGNSQDVIEIALTVPTEYYIRVFYSGQGISTGGSCYSLKLESGTIDLDQDGYTLAMNDCNDGNSNIHPHGTEVCNNMDDNCNGIIDDPLEVYTYTDNTSGIPNYVAANMSSTNLSQVNGAIAAPAPCPTGFTSKNFSSSLLFTPSLPAIEVTLSPSANYGLEVSSFSAEVRRSSTGPFLIRYAYSTDGGTTWIDQGTDQTIENSVCGVMTSLSWDFADFSATQPVKFRIYAFNAPSATGVLQIMNIHFDGNACSTLPDADHDGYNVSEDCNDASPAIHPFGAEICNFTDDDCDTQIDEGAQITFYADSDHDSYGNLNSTILACTVPQGYVSDFTDCNDANINIHPFAGETCNGIDDNCNGITDESTKVYGYKDDTTGVPSSVASLITGGSLKRVNGAGNASISCTTGFSSKKFTSATAFSTSLPAIEFTLTPNTGRQIEAASFYAELRRSSTGPASVRYAYSVDGGLTWIDQGANQSIPVNGCGIMTPVTWDFPDFSCAQPLKFRIYGFNASSTSGVFQVMNISLTGNVCAADVDNDGYNLTVDCNDGNASIHPNAAEACNNTDDDCDTQIDEDATTPFYRDADNDGYGNSGLFSFNCPPLTGYVSNNTDCNDANNAIHPNGAETCNSIDDNCNGITDEPGPLFNFDDNISGTPSSVPPHLSVSNLGVVNGALGASSSCPTGFSVKNFNTATLFNTTLPAIEFTITPAADFQIQGSSFSAELRRSGTGPTMVRFAYSADGGATWIDEGVDHALSTSGCGIMTAFNWDFADFTTAQPLKFRIYGFNASATSGIFQTLHVKFNGNACLSAGDADQDGYTAAVDCNDGNPAMHPNATEVCNGIDDDCDQQIDENVKTTFYADADHDLYGNPNVTTIACTAPAGYVADNTDCNDAVATAHPFAAETCNNIDDNCDGVTDEAVKLYYFDENLSGLPFTAPDHITISNLTVVNGGLTAPSSCPTGFSAKNFNTVTSFNTSLPAIEFTIFPATDYQLQATSFSVDLRRSGTGPSTFRLAYSLNGGTTWIDEGVDHVMAVSSCGITTPFIWDFVDFSTTQTFKFRIYCFNASSTSGIFQVLHLKLNGKVCFGTVDADQDGYNAGIDCNDGDAAIHPNATEVCNGIDDDCDLQIDEGVSTVFYADADNDTYGNPNVTITACSAPSGYVINSTDCNDGSTAVHPNAVEICNYIDDNCNGTTDEPGLVYNYTDNVSGTPLSVAANANGTNLTLVNGPVAVPAACPTGFSSKNFSNTTTFSTSLAAIEFTITPTAGYEIQGTSFSADLRRTSSGPALSRFAYSTNGGTTWIDQGIDQTLNNSTCGVTTRFTWDMADFSSSQPIKFRIYGFSATSTGGVLQLLNVSLNGNVCPAADLDHDGYSVPADCNDNNPAIHPNADEVCNTIDDDCDAQVDEGVKSVFYADADNDTYGNANLTILACSAPLGYVADNTDCNDGNTNVHPNAAETCNSIDDDCDVQIDEGVKTIFYADADNDGYGNSSVTILACSVPTGYAANNTDCNDGDASIHPNAQENCNNIDDDCDGSTDEPGQIYNYTNNTSGIPFSFAANVSVTNLTRVNGAGSASGCTPGFSSKNFSNATVFSTSLPAIEFTVTPNSGYKIDAVLFSAEMRRNGTGPKLVRFAYSINGGTTWIDEGIDHSLANAACGVMTSTTWDFADFSNSQPIKFRIYGFNASATGGALQLLNVRFNGKVCQSADGDNDGYDATVDCNDNNPAIHPNANEICNTVDDDCDAQIDEGVKSTFYADADNDGYGNAGVTILACAAPLGYVVNSTDCNDSNTNVHPNAAETCNSIDDDCDIQVDEGVKTIFYADADNDGYGNINVAVQACTLPSGYAANSTDCNDGDVNVHPNATETCNNIDDDCDGATDEAVQVYSYTDNTSGVPVFVLTNTTGSNLTRVNGAGFASGCSPGFSSKNFTNTLVFNTSLPAVEFTVTPAMGYKMDASSFSAELRRNGTGPKLVRFAYSTNGGTTWIDEGIDHSLANAACSEMTPATWDFPDFSTSQPVRIRIYGFNASATGGSLQLLNIRFNGRVCQSADGDNDGYDATVDCNDSNPAIHPNAAEVCNGIDDDCDVLVDEGVKSVFYADTDNDGYGNAGSSTLACSAPAGYVSDNTDCNDGNTSIHPNSSEVCNGVDDDCDVQVDEGVKTIFYADADNDNYGNPNVTVLACSVPTGYVSDNTDCNDGNTNIHPNGLEICNGVDDDCDVQIDEGVKSVFYADADNDNYGNPNVTILACSAPAGYVADNTDCNDSNTIIHPNGSEVCNGVDDDCDTQIDEGVKLLFYADTDNDNYGNPNVTILACSVPAGYVADNTDCNDSNTNIHPNAVETCNSIDDDCDVQVDEGVKSTFYADTDNDGYGDPNVTILACSAPAGYVVNNTDCNDAVSTIHPNATEICNSADDDCDGATDEVIPLYNYTDNTSGTPSFVSTNATGSSLTLVNGAGSASACPTGFTTKNFTNTTTFNTSLPAVEITISPVAGFQVEATSFSVDLRRGSSGPALIRFAYSTNGGATWIDQGTNQSLASASCGIMTSTSWDFADFSTTQSLKFRIYAFNASATSGNLQVLNFRFNGRICPASDADHDGYAVTVDCNDNDAAIHPDAAEICNGIDEDCDTQIDEGVKLVFYADSDNDNYGNANVTILACAPPVGYVPDNTDCNDANTNIHPNAVDVCNGVDDNCVGGIDENSITATITPADSTTTCTGVALTLNANTGTDINYQWLKDAADISGATNSSYATSTAGNYQVRESNSYNCASTSSVTKLTLLFNPTASITPLGNLDICETDSVVLQSNGNSPGLILQWLKEGSAIPGATNQFYTAKSTGTYQIMVTNGSFCTKTSTGVTVTKSCKDASISNTQEEDAFNIYPNPTDGHFVIELKLAEGNKQNQTATQDAQPDTQTLIQIINMIDQVVYQKVVTIHDGLLHEEIQLTNVAAEGIYFVRVITNDKEYSAQLVHQK